MHSDVAALEGSYNYGLVILSLIIAMSASYVALELASRTAATRGRIRAVWLAGGSISMGLGIWSMHYIGMLAFSLPVPVLYDLPTVFVSLLAAILASAVALFVVSRKDTALVTLIAGSLVMGGGIAAMHYIGMAAMRMAATHQYHMPTVTLSVAIAVVVSFAALFISLHLRGEKRELSPRKFGGAAIMGLAIASMHYTGMAGASFTPGTLHADAAHAISISALGITAITLATIMVLAVVALLAIIDQRYSEQSAELQISEERSRLLRAAKEAAEAASNAKTSFLATVSHEIRTPMNALMGLQELLSLTRLSDEQHEWLRLMRQSSKDLLHLIDDILDFSKIEAGKLDIGSEPTAIRELVRGVCDTFSVLAEEKGVKLRGDIAAGVPLAVMTDPFRLRQILSNLISNAIKFTQLDGEIHVRTTVVQVGSQASLEFQVADTGIGMAQEVVDRCGEPFQQADAGMARRYGGSGLGLAICKRLCMLMNGSLHIDSTPQTGTRITVQLPLHYVTDRYEPYKPEIAPAAVLSTPAKVPTIEEAATNRRLILVVDDHPTNRRLLVQQLEWLGYACESYGDARSALARFIERLSTNMSYAMVITDCQMPDMDGYELVRQIRAVDTGHAPHAVLIAFTADLSRSVAELTAASGFDAVLTKPMELMTLKANLERLIPLAQNNPPLSADLGGISSPMQALEDATLQDEFRVAHEEDMAMLKSGADAQDTALIARAAHRIRGAAKMIGAKALSESAATLEQVAPTGDWEQIDLHARSVYSATEQLYQVFESRRHEPGSVST